MPTNWRSFSKKILLSFCFGSISFCPIAAKTHQDPKILSQASALPLSALLLPKEEQKQPLEFNDSEIFDQSHPLLQDLFWDNSADLKPDEIVRIPIQALPIQAPAEDIEVVKATKIKAKANLDESRSYFNSISLSSVDIKQVFYENPVQDKEFPTIKLEASLYEPFPLSLEEVLAKAIENNINLNISREDSTIAKWELIKSVANMLPDVNLSLEGRDRDGRFFLNSRQSVDINEPITTASFRIDYKAFTGGTKTFLAWAQKHYSKAIKENEKLQFNQTLLDSVVLYNELMKEQLTLASRIAGVKEAKSDFNMATSFLDSGVGTKYELYQSEARLARSQRDLAEQQASFRLAEINMASHLNIPLTTPIIVNAEALEELSLIPKHLDTETFVEEAKENNPRIKSALANRKGAYKEAWSKVGTFLPDLNLFVDISGFGTDVGDLNKLTTLGFLLNYDIGKGLGLSPLSEVLQSRSKAKRAKLLYLQELLLIEKDLRTAYLNYEKSKSLINASKKAVQATKEGLRLARLRYQNGVGVFDEVLETQRELNDSEIELLESVAAYNNAQASLAFEMGTISIDSILNFVE